MKKLAVLCALAMTMSALSASAEPLFGFVYKNTVEPITGSSSAASTKVGVSCAKSFFGIVAIGNCSLSQAMKNGRISSLAYADVAVKNILGYKKVTTKAYGQ